MNFNTLTTTLTHFTEAFAGAYDRLMPVRNGLLGGLLVIEVVLVGLWWALGHGDQLANVIKKILFVGMWIWIATEFNRLAYVFMDSLVQAGLMAGGRTGDTGLLRDPSRIASYGLKLTEPLASSLSNVGLFDPSDAIIYGFCFLVILAAFFLMACQVFLAVLEFYLLVTVASVLLPFGILKPTKFLAEKAIAAVISGAIKLMVLAFVLAIAEPTLRNIHFSGESIRLNELLAVLFTTLTVALLTWKAPGMAAGLLAGSPSLSAGEMAAGATGGAMLAAGLVGGAVKATQMASKAFGAAVTPAARSAGGATAASVLGGGGGGSGGGGAAAGGASSAGASTGRAAGAVTSQPAPASPSAGSGDGSTRVDPGPPTIVDAGSPEASGAFPGRADPARPRGTAPGSSPPTWAAQTIQALRTGAAAGRAADGPGPERRPPATPGG